MSGYHLTPINKGIYGYISKILEEVQELADAEKQNSKIMIGCELSDIYGAVEAYAEKYNLTMNDLKIMSDITKRAFESGERVSSDPVLEQNNLLLDYDGDIKNHRTRIPDFDLTPRFTPIKYEPIKLRANFSIKDKEITKAECLKDQDLLLEERKKGKSEYIKRILEEYGIDNVKVFPTVPKSVELKPSSKDDDFVNELCSILNDKNPVLKENLDKFNNTDHGKAFDEFDLFEGNEETSYLSKYKGSDVKPNERYNAFKKIFDNYRFFTDGIHFFIFHKEIPSTGIVMLVENVKTKNNMFNFNFPVDEGIKVQVKADGNCNVNAFGTIFLRNSEKQSIVSSADACYKHLVCDADDLEVEYPYFTVTFDGFLDHVIQLGKHEIDKAWHHHLLCHHLYTDQKFVNRLAKNASEISLKKNVNKFKENFNILHMHGYFIAESKSLVDGKYVGFLIAKVLHSNHNLFLNTNETIEYNVINGKLTVTSINSVTFERILEGTCNGGGLISVTGCNFRINHIGTLEQGDDTKLPLLSYRRVNSFIEVLERDETKIDEVPLKFETTLIARLYNMDYPLELINDVYEAEEMNNKDNWLEKHSDEEGNDEIDENNVITDYVSPSDFKFNLDHLSKFTILEFSKYRAVLFIENEDGHGEIIIVPIKSYNAVNLCLDLPDVLYFNVYSNSESLIPFEVLYKNQLSQMVNKNQSYTLDTDYVKNHIDEVDEKRSTYDDLSISWKVQRKHDFEEYSFITVRGNNINPENIDAWADDNVFPDHAIEFKQHAHIELLEYVINHEHKGQSLLRDYLFSLITVD